MAPPSAIIWIWRLCRSRCRGAAWVVAWVPVAAGALVVGVPGAGVPDGAGVEFVDIEVFPDM